MADDDKKHAFMSVQLKGDNDDAILNNYNKNVGADGTTVKEALNIDGVEVQQAGLQPLASELTGTIGEDQKRAEVAAIPLVCVVLFFVFGGVIAAALPGIIGGLTIAGALGVMRLIAEFIPVHFFAQPVVTLMGLGIAVDYGLFMVSRFREELAEGYDTEAAVRRTVMTSGRTIMFSAVILVASSVPLLLFPQGFLKSITYAIIASVMLAAILSITVLAAALAILGPRVDSLGVKTLVKFAQPDPIVSDPANPRTNPFAIASIPVGILLPPRGHRARAHRPHTASSRPVNSGAGLALIGLVLGYISADGALGLRRDRPARRRHHRRRAVLDPARHRHLRRGGHRRPGPCARRAARPRPDRLVAELAGREDAEDQDARRGREGLLGQARQPRDEAARSRSRCRSSS